jgi:hypothetical protein
MKRIVFYFSLVLATFALFSCSGGGKNESVETYVSSYIKSNPAIVAFGKVDVKTMLAKADYEVIPKLGNILRIEKNRLEKSLNLNTPLYFALEAPFDKNGNPKALYAFAEVVNTDSLADRLGSSGLFVEQEGDFQYAIDGDLTIGFQDKIAVVISKKEKYDGKEAVKALLASLSDEKSGGKVDQILALKDDIVTGISLERLFATSNTELSKLDESKKGELENMVKDSYMQAQVRFSNGQVSLETKNLFSSALSNRMFFESKDNKQLLSKLGKGKARFGLAMQLEVPKMESFMDDFLADAKRKLLGANAQVQFATMTMGENPISSLFSGEFGAVLVGDLLKDGSITPEINFHVGLGAKGKTISDLANSFFTLGGNVKSTGGSFSYSGMDFIINEREVTGNTKNAGAGVSSLVLPQVASDFGKTGITGFVNFEGLNMSSFGFNGGSKMLEIVKNANLSIDNKGMRLVIRTTNPNENILHQVVQLYVKDIEKKVQGLVI